MTSLFSRINPTPSFPLYTGPHPVGTTDIEIPAASIPCGVQRPDSSITTIAFRIFYPCAPPSHSHKRRSKNVYWISSPQRQVLAAYARFLGANPTLASVFATLPNPLYHVSIPAERDAPLAHPEASPNTTEGTKSDGHKPTSQRWPTLVFSHGLGGSRNAYSHLCGSLASQGMVVIAPDHRDGSQPAAFMRKTRTTSAASVNYKRASHAASPEVYVTRDEQLKVRIWEMSAVLEALGMIDRGEEVEELHADPTTTTALEAFRGRLDIHTPGAVAFAGHSFGASTVVQLLKSAFHNGQVDNYLFVPDSFSATSKIRPAILSQITASTPTLLLDPWALPLNSPSTADLAAKPLPAFTASPPSSTSTNPQASDASPVIAILSSAFHAWTSNLHGVLSLLTPPSPQTHYQQHQQQQQPPHIFYPTSSAHLSQSDFGVLFPGVTKRFAKAGEPVRTLVQNVRAVVEVLRRQGGLWTGLSPVPVPDGEDESGDGEEEDGDGDDGFVMVDDGRDGEDGKVKGKGKEDRTGDWRILSREPGTVRGWVPVSLDEANHHINNNKNKNNDSSPVTSSRETKTKKLMAGPGPATEEGPLGVDDEMTGAVLERVMTGSSAAGGRE